MPQVIPFIPLIASVAGPLMGKLLGGGGDSSSGDSGGAGGITNYYNSGAPGGAVPSSPGVTPGTTPDDFKKQQTAQYQQMIAGLGIGGPNGELPTGIQENIDRQASLIS